jgi:hypothetical protein
MKSRIIGKYVRALLHIFVGWLFTKHNHSALARFKLDSGASPFPRKVRPFHQSEDKTRQVWLTSCWESADQLQIIVLYWSPASRSRYCKSGKSVFLR